MRYSKAGFYSIIMLLLVVQVVTANEIVIEGDGNPSYLTFMGDAPEGISAFGVEVRYSNGTQITGVEPVEPFEVVSGIDTAAGTLKIGGYALQILKQRYMVRFGWPRSGRHRRSRVI